MIIENNGNGTLAHADQVRLQNDSNEEMYSEPESNEGKGVTTRQTRQWIRNQYRLWIWTRTIVGAIRLWKRTRSLINNLLGREKIVRRQKLA